MRPGRLVVAASLIAVAGGAVTAQWLSVASTSALLATPLASLASVEAREDAIEEASQARGPPLQSTVLSLASEYPARPSAFAMLAAAAFAAGRWPEGDRLLTHAQKLSLRDDVVNLMVLRRAAARADFAAMARSADVVMRANRDLGALIAPALFEECAEPRFADALAERLARRPLWRLRFLEALGGSAAHAAGAGHLFEALKVRGAAASAEEVAPYFRTHAAIGDPAGLRRQWLRLDPSVARNETKLVYDGRFAGLGGSPPFNWVLASGTGIAVAPAFNGRARGLAVEVDAPTVVARQLIVAAPGRFQLSFHSRRAEEPAQSRFVVAVDCLGGQRIVARDIVPGNRDTATLIDFEVARGCRGQWLSFEVVGGLDGGQHAFTLSDVSIARLN